MATGMKSTKPEAATTVQAAEAELAALRAEQIRLQAVVSGEVHTETVRREAHQVVRQTGFAETVEVNVPHGEIRRPGPIERLRARRQLADLDDRILLAEEQVEQARVRAAADARADRAQAIERGERVVRAELPTLITELRATQERLARFAARLDELDGPIGDAYFAHRSPAFLVQQIEGWLGGMAEAFPPERR